MTIESLEFAVFTSVVRLESLAEAAEAHDMSAAGVSRRGHGAQAHDAFIGAALAHHAGWS
jgi:hypothetical protein